jgi:hypothetical protein
MEDLDIPQTIHKTNASELLIDRETSMYDEEI